MEKLVYLLWGDGAPESGRLIATTGVRALMTPWLMLACDTPAIW
jgi:hypothetical protein